MVVGAVLLGCAGEQAPGAAIGDSAVRASDAAGRPERARDGGARVTAAPSVARGTILVVGTSLTAGLGVDPSEAYPAVLARRIDSVGLNYEVVNAGVSGETSAGALERIDWLLRQPVDVFVLETGANDGLRGLSVASLRANLQAIIDKVRAAHPAAKLLVVGMESPPNLGPRYTSEFRAAFPEIARQNGAALVPFLLEGVAGVDSLNQGDGIHPNPAGARIAADNIWSVLRPMLDRPSLD